METTSTKSVQEAVQHLISQIQLGNILSVFEELYDEDIVMIEADGSARSGKALNRQSEEQFVGSVEAVHRAEVLSVNVNEEAQTSAVEWVFEFTFKGQTQRTVMNQVAVQYWKDAKIIREKFYSGKL